MKKVICMSWGWENSHCQRGNWRLSSHSKSVRHIQHVFSMLGLNWDIWRPLGVRGVCVCEGGMLFLPCGAHVYLRQLPNPYYKMSQTHTIEDLFALSTPNHFPVWICLFNRLTRWWNFLVKRKLKFGTDLLAAHRARLSLGEGTDS